MSAPRAGTVDTVLRDARLVVEHSLEVKAGENVVVIYDSYGAHERDGRALAKAATERGAEVRLFNNHAQVEEFVNSPDTFPPPPPGDLGRAMAASDVVVLSTHFQWMLSLFYVNYQATALARLRGSRVACLEQELGGLELLLDELRRTTNRVWAASRLLSGAGRVHVTSRGGTDVLISLEGRRAVHNAPVVPPGDIINLIPFYGETAFPPKETVGNGRIVIDGMMLGMGVGPHVEKSSACARRIPRAVNTRLVETPIELELKDGVCVKVSGGREAEVLRALFAEIPGANAIGEFALGLSESGPFAEAGMTARLGTAHFAFGDNITYGGRIACALHQNGVVQDASIRIVDTGQWLLREGQWQGPD